MAQFLLILLSNFIANIRILKNILCSYPANRVQFKLRPHIKLSNKIALTIYLDNWFDGRVSIPDGVEFSILQRDKVVGE